MLRPSQPFRLWWASLGACGIEHERAEVESQRKALTERAWRALIIFGLGISSLPSPSWGIVRVRAGQI